MRRGGAPAGGDAARRGEGFALSPPTRGAEPRGACDLSHPKNPSVDFLQDVLSVVLHLGDHLSALVRDFGMWSYAILFAVIFAETGLVVTPFLPGDSLLFAAGAVAASGAFNLPFLLLSLTVAAILGDAVNYHIGAAVGTRVFKPDARVLKTAYLERTSAFYDRYGGKTIILARFVPIVRTYAPFVAGAAKMPYSRFLRYNILGGILWIGSMTLAGYVFGNIPVVKDNFGLVVIAIIVISLIPPVMDFVRHRRETRAAQP